MWSPNLPIMCLIYFNPQITKSFWHRRHSHPNFRQNRISPGSLKSCSWNLDVKATYLRLAAFHFHGLPMRLNLWAWFSCPWTPKHSGHCRLMDPLSSHPRQIFRFHPSQYNFHYSKQHCCFHLYY